MGVFTTGVSHAIGGDYKQHLIRPLIFTGVALYVSNRFKLPEDT